jgi:hypothetical protein
MHRRYKTIYEGNLFKQLIVDQGANNIASIIPPKKSGKQMLKEGHKLINEELLDLPNVTYEVMPKNSAAKPVSQTPEPVQPSVHSVEIKNIKLGKNYYWCSCGLSKKQVLIKAALL